MAADFFIKATDTLPLFSSIPRGGDGKSILFSALPGGTTAVVRFQLASNPATFINGTGTIISTTDPVDGSTCVGVTYAFSGNPTPGLYYAEVELDYSGGGSETFPNSDTPATAFISAKLA